MEHDEAVAICLANLKGFRDKDLIRTAEALQYLKSLPNYGSNDKVGKAVGVSGEIVREFLSLLRLSEEVRHILGQRRLSLEQGRRLWQLGRHRPDAEVTQAAQAMLDMSAIDSRHLVDHLIRHPELSIRDAKVQVLGAKTVRDREYHVVAVVSEAEYTTLQRLAREREIEVQQLVSRVVQEWVGAEER